MNLLLVLRRLMGGQMNLLQVLRRLMGELMSRLRVLLILMVRRMVLRRFILQGRIVIRRVQRREGCGKGIRECLGSMEDVR